MRFPTLLALVALGAPVVGCAPAAGAPTHASERGAAETGEGAPIGDSVAHAQTVALLAYADDAAALGDTAGAQVHLRDAARVVQDAPAALVVAQASDRMGDGEGASRAYARYQRLVADGAVAAERAPGTVTVENDDGTVELVGAAVAPADDAESRPVAHADAPSEWSIAVEGTAASAARASAARLVALRMPAPRTAPASAPAPRPTASERPPARDETETRVARARAAARAREAKADRAREAKADNARADRARAAKAAKARAAKSLPARPKVAARRPATAARPESASSRGEVLAAADTARVAPAEPRRPSRWVRARDWVRGRGAAAIDFVAGDVPESGAKAPRPTVSLPGDSAPVGVALPTRP